MKSKRLSSLLILTTRLVLGSIFIYAGVTKIGKFNELAANIAQYELFTTAQIELLAHAIPLFEANLGIWLITGIRLRASSLGIALLTSIFFIATAQAQLRGLDIQCNCFGKQSELSAWQLLLRNSILSFASLILLVSNWRPSTGLESD